MSTETAQIETDKPSALDSAERTLAAMSGRDRPAVRDLHSSIEKLMDAARAARAANRPRSDVQDRLAAHLEKLESGISSLRDALTD